MSGHGVAIEPLPAAQPGPTPPSFDAAVESFLAGQAELRSWLAALPEPGSRPKTPARTAVRRRDPGGRCGDPPEATGRVRGPSVRPRGPGRRAALGREGWAWARADNRDGDRRAGTISYRGTGRPPPRRQGARAASQDRLAARRPPPPGSW